MKSPARRLFERVPARVSCLCALTLALLGLSITTHAQTTLLVATPTEPPAASPAPSPTGGDTPTVTVTPGLPSAADLAAYNAARTPQATVVLTPVSTPGSTTAAVNKTTASTALSAQGGVFSQIKLPAAPSPNGNKTSRTSTASSSQPVATVVLAYNATWAGQVVWVQVLNGGTLTAADDSGIQYTAGDGFLLMLSTEGATTFNYQPPAVSGTYQVLTRLDNVTTTLPFLVPDAGQ